MSTNYRHPDRHPNANVRTGRTLAAALILASTFGCTAVNAHDGFHSPGVSIGFSSVVGPFEGLYFGTFARPLSYSEWLLLERRHLRYTRGFYAHPLQRRNELLGRGYRRYVTDFNRFRAFDHHASRRVDNRFLRQADRRYERRVRRAQVERRAIRQAERRIEQRVERRIERRQEQQRDRRQERQRDRRQERQQDRRQERQRDRRQDQRQDRRQDRRRDS